MRLPADSADRIERAIESAEELTSVEIVLRAQPFSGSYRDVEYLVGGLFALAQIAYALFGAALIAPLWVVPTCIAAFGVGWGVCRLSPHLKRLLTTRTRRAHQAREAAVLVFVRDGIDRTRGRTGLLVYVSFLERTVELVADRGLQAIFPRSDLRGFADDLHATLHERDPVEAFSQRLILLGEELGERLPPGEDNPDELANAPVLEGGE